ncbi:MAG: heme-binding domain-containing protein [Saprospiraceae bacterium]|nr:heme-binding domain-containing protein [Saprospiraceae bacterium]
MKKWLWAIPALLVIIQFVRIDKTNPPANPENDYLSVANPPSETAQLIKTTCYDCHSNHTRYPWYSNVAPVSWLLRNHIVEGRKHLNFSEWAAYDAEKQAHKIEECAEVIGEKEMPMKGYVWMHPEARLSEAQREQLVDWFSMDSKDEGREED